MSTYRALPPEVVARAAEWLDIGALATFSPVSAFSNRCATAAFEALAKRRYHWLARLASHTSTPNWRRLLYRHLCFERNQPAHWPDAVRTNEYLFVFEWYDGPPREGGKCLGSADAELVYTRTGEKRSLMAKMHLDTIPTPPPFVQCFVRHRVDHDRCALVYRGKMSSTADREGISITSYKVAKPWIHDSWTVAPDSSNIITSAFYRSDTKQLCVPFYEVAGDVAAAVSPS
eukprot:CAMPEP_0119276836 /NCGR_PEP_ID=MMETSP1329-20130426/16050_1 /TAXON_ID=114041 /ORGANISM="Genus nov. species nov., Strain RCC1024" /LENGTH=230 /DNA_ID=CAMNT_0007277279 /DNA_START=198 /DNA_END=886 /DNA_ORIENTATION=-